MPEMRTLFVCDCGDIAHQFVIQYDEDYPEDPIFVSIHLTSTSFWRRLVYGVQYIFGRKSIYNSGAFSEVLLDEKKTKELIEVLSAHHISMKKT
jgi:hypothetical protein